MRDVVRDVRVRVGDYRAVSRVQQRRLERQDRLQRLHVVKEIFKHLQVHMYGSKPAIIV